MQYKEWHHLSYFSQQTKRQTMAPMMVAQKKTAVILDSDSDAYNENLNGTDEDKVDLTEGPVSPCQTSVGCSSSVKQ
jgi:hypothetical protein